MPYIKKSQRNLFEYHLSKLIANNPGELNYLLTRISLNYINTCDDTLKYQHLNDGIGALECCKLELYRRLAVPYEDLKVEENGDVY